MFIYSVSFPDVPGISQTRKKDPPALRNSRSKNKDEKIFIRGSRKGGVSETGSNITLKNFKKYKYLELKCVLVSVATTALGVNSWECCGD